MPRPLPARTGAVAATALVLLALTAPPASTATAGVEGGGCGGEQKVEAVNEAVYGYVTACVSSRDGRISPDGYVRLSKAVPGCQLVLGLVTFGEDKTVRMEHSCPPADNRNRRFVNNYAKAAKGQYLVYVRLLGTGGIRGYAESRTLRIT